MTIEAYARPSQTIRINIVEMNYLIAQDSHFACLVRSTEYFRWVQCLSISRQSPRMADGTVDDRQFKA